MRTARYAREKGIESISIMSNGSWGRQLEIATLTARELLASGVNQMYITTGLDHQRFVSEQSVLNAVAACREADLYVELDVESDLDDDIITRLAQNPVLQGVKLASQNWITWKTGEPRIQEKMKMLHPFSGAGCESVWKTCYIDHSDTIRACCGQFCTSMPRLILGEKLEDWYRRTPLQMWIATDSPYFLYSLLKKENEMYPWHECHACLLLQNRLDYFEQLETIWPHHRDSVIDRHHYIRTLLIETQKAKNENH